jgi:uncharacterized protein
MKNTTLITGASSGIGRELARICAREGHHLVITARREELLNRLKDQLETEFSVSVEIFPCDLAEPGSPEQIMEFVRKKDITVDILINNAGVGDYGIFYESDWPRQQSIIDLNIKALTHLTHLFLPGMVARKSGKILNLASVAGFMPGPLMSVYYASKNYVRAFSEALVNELRGSGVTVTVLCPGPTTSEFQQKANMQKSKLFDRFPVPSAAEVSEYGYRSMMKGKPVAVYGLINKVITSTIGMVPRNWTRDITRRIQERK